MQHSTKHTFSSAGGIASARRGIDGVEFEAAMQDPLRARTGGTRVPNQ